MQTGEFEHVYLTARNPALGKAGKLLKRVSISNPISLFGPGQERPDLWSEKLKWLF